MKPPEIRQKFIEILTQWLAVEPDKVKDESDLYQDLHADSLDMVEIVMDCEVEFAVDIPDEDAETLKTVKQWVDYLEAQTVEPSLEVMRAALDASPGNPFLKGHVAALEGSK